MEFKELPKAKPLAKVETTFSSEAIGYIESCFREKFTVPRQPMLARNVEAVIHLKDHPFYSRALDGLESFSHLWVIFVFHQMSSKDWKPSVRPPRLGGRQKMGVLATRSPHRPNPIGLSVVKIEKIIRPETSREILEQEGLSLSDSLDPVQKASLLKSKRFLHKNKNHILDFGLTEKRHGKVPSFLPKEYRYGPKILISGHDFLDQTPILDIKPYLPFIDSVKGAKAGWAFDKIPRSKVRFTKTALKELKEISGGDALKHQKQIKDLMSLDPRPAFQHTLYEGEYGFRYFDFDVKWRPIKKGLFEVFHIESLEN